MAGWPVRARFGLLAGALVVASCGGGGAPAATTSPAATPSVTAAPTAFAGQVVEIAAKNLQFSPTAVTVQAGADFEIVLDNQDETSHAIYVTPGKRPFVMQTLEQYENGPYPFKGEYVPMGKTITYHVGALSPGAYQFFCPPHQDMVITVTVS